MTQPPTISPGGALSLSWPPSAHSPHLSHLPSPPQCGDITLPGKEEQPEWEIFLIEYHLSSAPLNTRHKCQMSIEASAE